MSTPGFSKADFTGIPGNVEAEAIERGQAAYAATYESVLQEERAKLGKAWTSTDAQRAKNKALDAAMRARYSAIREHVRAATTRPPPGVPTVRRGGQNVAGTGDPLLDSGGTWESKRWVGPGGLGGGVQHPWLETASLYPEVDQTIPSTLRWAGPGFPPGTTQATRLITPNSTTPGQPSAGTLPAPAPGAADAAPNLEANREAAGEHIDNTIKKPPPEKKPPATTGGTTQLDPQITALLDELDTQNESQGIGPVTEVQKTALQDYRYAKDLDSSMKALVTWANEGAKLMAPINREQKRNALALAFGTIADNMFPNMKTNWSGGIQAIIAERGKGREQEIQAWKAKGMGLDAMVEHLSKMLGLEVQQQNRPTTYMAGNVEVTGKDVFDAREQEKERSAANKRWKIGQMIGEMQSRRQEAAAERRHQESESNADRRISLGQDREERTREQTARRNTVASVNALVEGYDQAAKEIWTAIDSGEADKGESALRGSIARITSAALEREIKKWAPNQKKEYDTAVRMIQGALRMPDPVSRNNVLRSAIGKINAIRDEVLTAANAWADEVTTTNWVNYTDSESADQVAKL